MLKLKPQYINNLVVLQDVFIELDGVEIFFSPKRQDEFYFLDMICNYFTSFSYCFTDSQSYNTFLQSDFSHIVTSMKKHMIVNKFKHLNTNVRRMS